MCKAYKDMDLTELSVERMRLKYILRNHPKQIEYKQAKASLETVEKLMSEKVGGTLKNESKQS